MKFFLSTDLAALFLFSLLMMLTISCREDRSSNKELQHVAAVFSSNHNYGQYVLYSEEIIGKMFSGEYKPPKMGIAMQYCKSNNIELNDCLQQHFPDLFEIVKLREAKSLHYKQFIAKHPEFLKLNEQEQYVIYKNHANYNSPTVKLQLSKERNKM